MIVFDMDGTLSIVSDRVELLKTEPKQWDEYFARCGEDKPNWPIIDLCLKLSEDSDIIICTGRPDSVRDETEEWLNYHDIDYKLLLMRPTGNHGHDIHIKPVLLEPYREEIELIFEDRNSMVAEWRKLGYVCLQVAEGDF